MDSWAAVAAVLLLLAIAAWLGLRWRAPRSGPAIHCHVGCIEPNDPVLRAASNYITEASAWLAEQLLALEPGTQWGGTYANKPGYHNTRSQNDPGNYSVVDSVDKGGPSGKAAGYDWTFPEAQSGDYRRISLYTSRLLASAKDLNDPRLDGWREFYGQADADSYVEGWDCRYGYACTSDSSHLWHIHLSESRDQVESKANKEALLSVLRGETVAQWLGATTNGDGAVILNCPYDNDRLDVFYVGPDGDVMHNWYSSGGMGALWNGTGKAESLGGVIVPGTLSAAWDPQGTLVNIIGLGAPDDDTSPHGAGQYWGFTLTSAGAKSGWGSLPKVYGQLPASNVVRTHRPDTRSEWRRPATWLLIVAVLLIAASLVSLWIR